MSDGGRFTVKEVLRESGSVVLKFDRPFKDKNGKETDRFSVDNVGLADVIVGARPDAVFEKVGNSFRLVHYAPDVADGAASEPAVDLNPYSFAAWAGLKPLDAQHEALATHEGEHAGRFSGIIDVTLTARTPLFVPEGHVRDKKADGARWFFHLWDGRTERYAIPGSSVKGPVRALFEILTNSRCSVADVDDMEHPRLYRRRSAVLFLIEAMPRNTAPWRLRQVRYAFLDQTHQFVSGDRSVMTNASGVTLPWRANLLCVDSTKYDHRGKCRIRYVPGTMTYDLTEPVVGRYLLMRDHPHFKDHPGHVKKNRRTSRYRSPDGGKLAPSYQECADDLFTLKVGDLVFGIPNGTEIVCFGKNVNFLWPSEKTPLDLLGEFRPRGDGCGPLDPAEAVFGSIASGDVGRRGRVRFTTFWGPQRDEVTPEVVRLMPLTAPSGGKLKARPLCLAPEVLAGGTKRTATYSAASALRGRKLYWHQRASDDKVPLQHHYDELELPNGPELTAEMLPEPIAVLPTDTQFKGRVEFLNLTGEELGALLAAIDPRLLFDNEGAYGLKIGKAKPRGLGSVLADVRLSTLRPAKPDPGSGDAEVGRYQRLNARLLASEDGSTFVDRHRRWIASQLSEANWNDLPFVRDLKRLLRIPTAEGPCVRLYPTRFDMYGWLPAIYLPGASASVPQANGDPKGGPDERPRPMRLAREEP